MTVSTYDKLSQLIRQISLEHFLTSPHNAIKYELMWPFKRKTAKQNTPSSGIACSHCGSTRTEVVAHYLSDPPDYVRTWRGKRYITCRCLECGRDFYFEAPLRGLPDEVTTDDQTISDEEELRAAEEEIKRDLEEGGDRRCP